VNLQYGDITDKIQAFNEQSQRPIIDLDIDKLADLDSLLALIDACDLVITISNVTAHLACSLGKECWILLPWGWPNLWYWHLNGESTPWYPSARIFRQGRDEDWTQIFQGISVALAERVKHPDHTDGMGQQSNH